MLQLFSTNDWAEQVHAASGSGKTFTVTGGPERYADRGLTPRAISVVFGQVANRCDCSFSVRSRCVLPLRCKRPCKLQRLAPQVHVTYMEIYNEVGYDLLAPAGEVRELEDLPRVAVREDEAGSVHLGHLSVHRANSEEEALNLVRMAALPVTCTVRMCRCAIAY